MKKQPVLDAVVNIMVRFGPNFRQQCPFCRRFFKGVECSCGTRYEQVEGDNYKVVAVP